MQIGNLSVSPERHSSGSVIVAGDYGKQRVIAVINRVDLDDYFERGWPQLDDTQRRLLVEGNKATIADLMGRKCAAGEWQDDRRPGGVVKRVDIALVDLLGVTPRLTDEALKGRHDAD